MATEQPTLGEYLRDLRARKAWSMVVLSKESGINYQHLSRIENNSIVPMPETVVKLAESLGGDLGYMLELADCLPKQILERLSARPQTPALRRSAGGGRSASSPNARAETLAREMGVPESEVTDVANAVVRLMALDVRRRRAVVQLMKTFDGRGGGTSR
jgi:transcriptional regulator with XRE-family HTH domain